MFLLYSPPQRLETVTKRCEHVGVDVHSRPHRELKHSSKKPNDLLPQLLYIRV